MTVRPIIQHPDPILEERCRTVTAFDLGLLPSLIRDLRETAEAQVGPAALGLAAPQIGRSLRVCIVRNGDDWDVYVNPEIVSVSAATSIMDESCLSIPDLHIPLVRPISVEVSASDETTVPVTRRLDGPAARVAQHEIDHLDGITIIRRAGITAEVAI